jgi:hypothetical protein
VIPNHTKHRVSKVLGWTLGIAPASFLILDGKTITKWRLLHIFVGGVVGFILGHIFWNLKNK